MREHPSSEQLNLYHRRALAPDIFLSIHRHVSACPVCSEQWYAPSGVKEDYEALLAALMPAPDDEAYHLTQAERAGYVQGNLDAVSIETAESHLEVCAECVQAVAQLRAITVADSFVPDAETVNEKQQGSGHQAAAGLMAFFNARHRPAQFASLLLFICGLILATLLFIRSRNGQPAQPSTARDESASLNANNRDTLQSNSQTDSQTDSPPLADKSAASINGEQSPSQIGNEERQDDSRSVAPVFNEGGRDVGVEKLSPSLRRAITLALTRQRLERPQVLAELNGANGTLLSEPGDGLPFHLISPLGKVVQSRTLTFRWRPLAGASSYVVTITDNQLNEVATSGPLTKTEWAAPMPLKRGGIYSWQVTAFKDGKEVTSPVMPAPQAKFKVMDQAHYEELNRVKRAFPNYYLALGVLYTRAGLLDEAEREFQAQLKATPHSAVARKLLHSVRSMKKSGVSP